MEQETKVRRKPARRRTRREGGEALIKAASDSAAWERACAEITASILSDQVHKMGQIQIDPQILMDTMRNRVSQAKIELGEHALEDVMCDCRHKAIITVGANQQARMCGGPPGVYFDGARLILERYLARRS